MAPVTPSQRYLSSRGGSYDRSFEDVVLQGLAPDGGLYMPEHIPQLPQDWLDSFINWSFQDLAFHIFSLYVSSDEIPSSDLKDIINKSYANFRVPEITPLLTLQEEDEIYLLEIYHGPTLAFKDVALQFLGFLFEYFLVRKNEGKDASNREVLTVLGATSGDTGSAAIYGLRHKKDVSIIILHPEGRISPIQEAQMTSVLDENVHNISIDGTFDDCQDMVKALFGDEEIKKTHKLAAVNSVNWARILAQITYYFYSYGSLVRSGRIRKGQAIRFSVPTGNFGDVLAGYFAKRMGLPIEKFVIATNENDILHRFWQSGSYEKKPVRAKEANGGFPEDGALAHEEGVKATLSPAMDILVSSNFERLLWFLAFQVYGGNDKKTAMATAGEKVKSWLSELKTKGGFSVEASILEAAKVDFESERVSDPETLASIRQIYHLTQSTPAVYTSPDAKPPHNPYILDPHSAIGVAAALRSQARSPAPAIVSLATAHPAKFSRAVEEALKDEPGFDFADVLPEQFRGLEELPRRKHLFKMSEGIEGMRREIRKRVPASGVA